MRARASFLVVLLGLIPAHAFAQAWVPPKGELFFTLTYQWLEANDHLFSDAVLGPELTPLEQLNEADFTSTRADFGVVRSQVIILDGDLGLTDRLALTGGLAFVQSQYVGDSPDDPALDDGTYRGNFQDARIGARYMALDGPWLLTPFATAVLPTTDYPVLAHVAIGRGLKELQLGTSLGRILTLRGLPIGFVQGSYSYVVMENPSDDIQIDRSSVQLSFGYFHSALTLQGFAGYQKTHGGIDWALDIGSHQADQLGAIVGAHDQAARADHWQLGGALAFEVSDQVDLYVALNDTLWGANTHDARTVTFGLSWGVRAFGGFGKGVRARDDETTENE